MASLEELVSEDKIYVTIGKIVVRWNDFEEIFRLVLYKAAGGHGVFTDVLIANLNNSALSQTLLAIAGNHESFVGEHLRHCANIFDIMRA